MFTTTTDRHLPPSPHTPITATQGGTISILPPKIFGKFFPKRLTNNYIGVIIYI